MGDVVWDQDASTATSQLVEDLLSVARRYSAALDADEVDSLYVACGTLDRLARRLGRRTDSNP